MGNTVQKAFGSPTKRYKVSLSSVPFDGLDMVYDEGDAVHHVE
jgi:hypothetical protein